MRVEDSDEQKLLRQATPQHLPVRISGAQASGQSEEQGEEPQFVAFAEFCSANTSAIANVKLLNNF